jgi:5-methylcytosine-specific restriction endonuclease McrA
VLTRHLTEADCAIDHEQPTSRGGSHGLANVQVICRQCNETKAALTTAEFAQLVAAMVP